MILRPWPSWLAKRPACDWSCARAFFPEPANTTKNCFLKIPNQRSYDFSHIIFMPPRVPRTLLSQLSNPPALHMAVPPFSVTPQHLAVKVLNPIGYKLAPSGSLRFCEVIVKGQPYGDVGGGFGGRGSRGGGGGHGGPGGGSGGGSGSGSGGGAGKMTEKHVWWLFNSSTRQTIAAYYDARTGVLKEMTLPKCIEVRAAALDWLDCVDCVCL